MSAVLDSIGRPIGNTFDPWDAVFQGADPTGSIDSTDAIVRAAEQAAAEDEPLVLNGSFKTSATIDLSSVQTTIAHNAFFLPTFDGVAVQYVGPAAGLIENHKLLGNLTVQWSIDWTKDRTSFYFSNVYNGEFHIASLYSTRAVFCRGNQSGVVQNHFHLGAMGNNLVGVWLDAVDATGWCNANHFHGGFFFGSASIAGSLHASQAGHIYISSSPYLPNGNVFDRPSLEWVSVGGGFRLARLGGTRNRLMPKYAESNSGDTTWIVDTGTENTIDVDFVPYLIGYDPTLSGANNRVDVSGATAPLVNGVAGYRNVGGQGTQYYASASTTKPTMSLANAGGGDALALEITAGGFRMITLADYADDAAAAAGGVDVGTCYRTGSIIKVRVS